MNKVESMMNREPDMLESLAQDIRRLLSQGVPDMDHLKIQIAHYMRMLNVLFQADIQLAVNQQEVRSALEDLIERLMLMAQVPGTESE